MRHGLVQIETLLARCRLLGDATLAARLAAAAEGDWKATAPAREVPPLGAER
jgi:hypothetical protein